MYCDIQTPTYARRHTQKKKFMNPQFSLTHSTHIDRERNFEHKNKKPIAHSALMKLEQRGISDDLLFMVIFYDYFCLA